MIRILNLTSVLLIFSTPYHPVVHDVVRFGVCEAGAPAGGIAAHTDGDRTGKVMSEARASKKGPEYALFDIHISHRYDVFLYRLIRRIRRDACRHEALIEVACKVPSCMAHRPGQWRALPGMSEAM